METELEMGRNVLEEVERKTKTKLEFEETELRLGLPGGVKQDDLILKKNTNGKRNFAETVDLKLNLSSKEAMDLNKNLQKDNQARLSESVKPPAAKAQVVGWPPVRSFRKNIIAVQIQKSSLELEESGKVSTGSPPGALVKVSMDGAPYLRKVDLKMYKTYRELSDALADMFHSFTIGKCESEGMMDFMNESKLIDLLNNSDYVPTYEDKDGDWMLVGDVPWEMFVESCKRLRIMKGAEAIGIAPRALAKCKKVQKQNM
ncbi:hypothetical protein ACH5RR_010599 [Cinchona calisaya]|uniref:Auxin-responsive protein n=1 Tax=Cinchona calisaya TaxID=153742 RepID=A0ABD3AJD4_9GENT